MLKYILIQTITTTVQYNIQELTQMAIIYSLLKKILLMALLVGDNQLTLAELINNRLNIEFRRLLISLLSWCIRE